MNRRDLLRGSAAVAAAAVVAPLAAVAAQPVVIGIDLASSGDQSFAFVIEHVNGTPVLISEVREWSLERGLKFTGIEDGWATFKPNETIQLVPAKPKEKTSDHQS